MKFLFYLSIWVGILKSEKLGSLYLDNSDKNEFEKSELKKNFGILIDSFFIQYDKEKKGYLTEEEFGKY